MDRESLDALRLRAQDSIVAPVPAGPFHLFAEVKPMSPTEGFLGVGDLPAIAREYEMGGATTLSVLTEPTRFGGSLGLVEDLVRVVGTPIMRKDFLVDPYQVWEARASGASGVLLIARMFDRPGLARMLEEAREAELFSLVEVFDEDDLRLLDLPDQDEPKIFLGVNSRDLATLTVRRDTHQRLVEKLPGTYPKIAESGISTPEHVSQLREMGYQGVLVGTSLMRSERPDELIAAMVQAGRGVQKA